MSRVVILPLGDRAALQAEVDRRFAAISPTPSSSSTSSFAVPAGFKEVVVSPFGSSEGIVSSFESGEGIVSAGTVLFCWLYSLYSRVVSV